MTSEWQVRYWHTFPKLLRSGRQGDCVIQVTLCCAAGDRDPWEDADVASTAGHGKGSPGTGKRWKIGRIPPLHEVRLGVFQGRFLDFEGLQFLICYTVRKSKPSDSEGKGEPPLETPSQIRRSLTSEISGLSERGQ